MAVATSKTNNIKDPTWVQKLASTRAFKLVNLFANIVLPLAVVTLMYVGARDVSEHRQQIDVAKKELETLQRAFKVALRDSERIEKEKKILQVQVEQLKKEIKENDPVVVIQRIKEQLGGVTPGARADSFWRRGRDAYDAKNTKLAEALFLESIKEQEQFAPAIIGLGRLAADRGEFRVAEKHYRRAIAADSKNPHATYNLALTEFILKKTDEAEKYAKQTLEIDPNYEEAKKLLKQIEERRRTIP